MSLALSEQAETPVRAVANELRDLMTARLTEIFVKISDPGNDHAWWKCGHVDPRDARLHWRIANEVWYAIFQTLEGSGDKHIEMRAQLRDALAETVGFDEVAPAIADLAAAIKRRQVYFVVRRAGALLEQLGELDGAAVLAEIAAKHEPIGDGVQFSRKRRLKSELKREGVTV